MNGVLIHDIAAGLLVAVSCIVFCFIFGTALASLLIPEAEFPKTPRWFRPFVIYRSGYETVRFWWIRIVSAAFFCMSVFLPVYALFRPQWGPEAPYLALFGLTGIVVWFVMATRVVVRHRHPRS